MSETMKGQIIPAVLGGKGANGNERDKGAIVHAVKNLHPTLLDLSSTAECGKQHGPRSVGFVARRGEAVTCPKCLKAMGEQ